MASRVGYVAVAYPTASLTRNCLLEARRFPASANLPWYMYWIPSVPPTETVSTLLISYPYPTFVISKSITLDPCPTTTLTFAALPPVSPIEVVEYDVGRLSYGRGSSKSTFRYFATLPPLA